MNPKSLSNSKCFYQSFEVPVWKLDRRSVASNWDTKLFLRRFCSISAFILSSISTVVLLSSISFSVSNSTSNIFCSCSRCLSISICFSISNSNFIFFMVQFCQVKVPLLLEFFCLKFPSMSSFLFFLCLSSLSVVSCFRLVILARSILKSQIALSPSSARILNSSISPSSHWVLASLSLDASCSFSVNPYKI